MTNRIALSDRAIAFIAPRGTFDYWSKVLLLLLLIGLVNFLRDTIEYGDQRDSLLSNTIEAAFTGLPFCVLALSLIGRLKRMQDNLIALATTDMLTGLHNRRAFYDKVRLIYPKLGGVLMMIDVDHFKRVNDSYGHGVGDLCLKEIAKHLCGAVRANDIVARLGGEEFAVVLIGADRDTAEKIGARLAEGVQFQSARGATIGVTVSVGAIIMEGQDDFEDYMRLADEALYDAKSKGRARMIMAEQMQVTAVA
jgi:diguanylate cyclase (GGDEF)-like protein